METFTLHQVLGLARSSKYRAFLNVVSGQGSLPLLSSRREVATLLLVEA